MPRPENRNPPSPMGRDRIAVFLNVLLLGGAERVLIRLARALKERGYRVDLVLVHKRGPLLEEVPDTVRIIELGKSKPSLVKLSLLRLAPRSGVAMPRILASNLPNPIKSVPRLMRYLRKERPSALLATLPKNNIAAVWAAKLWGLRTRVVIREACTLSRETARSSKPFDRLLPQLVRQWYPDADGIVSVSDGVADDLTEQFGVPPARITTIFNPVDAERIALGSEAGRRALVDAGSTTGGGQRRAARGAERLSDAAQGFRSGAR